MTVRSRASLSLSLPLSLSHSLPLPRPAAHWLSGSAAPWWPSSLNPAAGVVAAASNFTVVDLLKATNPNTAEQYTGLGEQFCFRRAGF